MADNTYDVNYGAIPSTCISGAYGSDTITLDYSTPPSMGNYTMSSGTSTIPYTLTTTGGTGTYNPFDGYNNAVWTTGIGGSSGSSTVHIDADGLTMKEGADIKIGGKSLTQAIEKIEERLGILRPNAALEERWDKLKDLRRQYMEMEKDILEKEKIMKILKEA
jgi:hypothetical protein